MRRLSSVLLVLALVVLVAGPVRADGSEVPEPTDAVELSLDGVHWSEDAITTPLFDPRVRWVPGDVRVETFYVRSTMPDAGALKVTVERSARDALLDTGWLSLSARAGAGRWTSIESGGRHVLVDKDRLAGTGVVPVQVRAAFGSAAPNGTMVLDSDLDFDVVLADATVVLGEGGSGGSPGELPGTGSEIRPWLTPLALLLIATGAVLVVRRRHEDPEDACADLEQRHPLA